MPYVKVRDFLFVYKIVMNLNYLFKSVYHMFFDIIIWSSMWKLKTFLTNLEYAHEHFISLIKFVITINTYILILLFAKKIYIWSMYAIYLLIGLSSSSFVVDYYYYFKYFDVSEECLG